MITLNKSKAELPSNANEGAKIGIPANVKIYFLTFQVICLNLG
jgi:hypothetical protein